MKTLILILSLAGFLVAGCESQAERRAALVGRFQELYPETWEQELFQYDIQEDRFRREMLSHWFAEQRQPVHSWPRPVVAPPVPWSLLRNDARVVPYRSGGKIPIP